MQALFLSKNIVNPLRVGVTIKEKRALILAKQYPLSGERLGFGSFLYRKVVGFYKNKKGYFLSILKKIMGHKHNKWVCINYSKGTKFANFGFSTKGPFYDHLSPFYVDIRLKMI